MEDTSLPGSEQITFRNLTPPESAKAVIRERMHDLTTYAADIISCRVVVEAPHQHHQRGNRYHVRISAHVPGDEIVVAHQPSGHAEERQLEGAAHRKGSELAAVDRDLYTAIHEAFDLARRQLQDHVRRSRGDVKQHEARPHGRVSRLSKDDGFGFITASDGREIYFHQNAVLGDAFRGLELGSEVSFAEEPGDKGPQASSVHLVGKHHVD